MLNRELIGPAFFVALFFLCQQVPEINICCLNLLNITTQTLVKHLPDGIVVNLMCVSINFGIGVNRLSSLKLCAQCGVQRHTALFQSLNEYAPKCIRVC